MNSESEFKKYKGRVAYVGPSCYFQTELSSFERYFLATENKKAEKISGWIDIASIDEVSDEELIALWSYQKNNESYLRSLFAELNDRGNYWLQDGSWVKPTEEEKRQESLLSFFHEDNIKFKKY